MKYQPKVTIVIPAYNASNYLSEAIDSALAQTYTNTEIIVVNDGSCDEGATAAVARKYEGKIRYIEKKNGGSSSALNYGIWNMTGEWFSWLSHDDLYYPDKVQCEVEYLNHILENNTIEDLHRYILFAAADIIDSRGIVVQKTSKRKLFCTDRRINRPDGALYLIAEPVQNGFHGCSCLIHRTAFEDCGVFDERLKLLNDMDMWFRFYSRGYRIRFVPRTLVMGRVHGAQVSRKIGFSYHNPEQDWFWNRSLNWLLENYPTKVDLLYLYGKTAFLKTRYEEGERAFQIVAAIDKGRGTELWLKKQCFICFSKCREFAKSLYIRINT